MEGGLIADDGLVEELDRWKGWTQLRGLHALHKGRKGELAQELRRAAAAAEAEAAEAEAAEAAEAEAAEAEAAEARRASARHARQAQLAGSVAEVNASRADKVAFAEAELMLTVEQVALRKMRAQRHGWVCALWVQKQLRVFLAHDLDGGDGGRKEGWIEEVVAGGRKERAPVRVAEGQLESQRLVVMDEQEFFFFDIDGVDLFSDLGGDKKAEPVVDELEPPPVHCRGRGHRGRAAHARGRGHRGRGRARARPRARARAARYARPRAARGAWCQH